jgi:hypothetical protein
MIVYDLPPEAQLNVWETLNALRDRRNHRRRRATSPDRIQGAPPDHSLAGSGV